MSSPSQSSHSDGRTERRDDNILLALRTAQCVFDEGMLVPSTTSAWGHWPHASTRLSRHDFGCTKLSPDPFAPRRTRTRCGERSLQHVAHDGEHPRVTSPTRTVVRHHCRRSQRSPHKGSDSRNLNYLRYYSACLPVNTAHPMDARRVAASTETPRFAAWSGSSAKTNCCPQSKWSLRRPASRSARSIATSATGKQ